METRKSDIQTRKTDIVARMNGQQMVQASNMGTYVSQPPTRYPAPPTQVVPDPHVSQVGPGQYAGPEQFSGQHGQYSGPHIQGSGHQGPYPGSAGQFSGPPVSGSQTPVSESSVKPDVPSLKDDTNAKRLPEPNSNTDKESSLPEPDNYSDMHDSYNMGGPQGQQGYQGQRFPPPQPRFSGPPPQYGGPRGFGGPPQRFQGMGQPENQRFPGPNEFQGPGNRFQKPPGNYGVDEGFDSRQENNEYNYENREYLQQDTNMPGEDEYRDKSSVGPGSRFPAPQGGFPAQQGGFSSQQGGFPAQQGGFPAQQGGFPAQQGGRFPGQSGPRFPGQNDPRFSGPRGPRFSGQPRYPNQNDQFGEPPGRGPQGDAHRPPRPGQDPNFQEAGGNEPDTDYMDLDDDSRNDEGPASGQGFKGPRAPQFGNRFPAPRGGFDNRGGRGMVRGAPRMMGPRPPAKGPISLMDIRFDKPPSIACLSSDKNDDEVEEGKAEEVKEPKPSRGGLASRRRGRGGRFGPNNQGQPARFRGPDQLWVYRLSIRNMK